MPIEGIDPYSATPTVQSPPPEANTAPPEQEVITEEDTGNNINTTA